MWNLVILKGLYTSYVGAFKYSFKYFAYLVSYDLLISTIPMMQC